MNPSSILKTLLTFCTLQGGQCRDTTPRIENAFCLLVFVVDAQQIIINQSSGWNESRKHLKRLAFAVAQSTSRGCSASPAVVVLPLLDSLVSLYLCVYHYIHAEKIICLWHVLSGLLPCRTCLCCDNMKTLKQNTFILDAYLRSGK